MEQVDLGLGLQGNPGFREMEMRVGRECQAEEMAQVKALGSKGDVLEVKRVDTATKEVSSKFVWGEKEERQETLQGCEERLLEK